MQAYLDPNDTVVSFSPCFDIYKSSVALQQANLREVPIQDGAFDIKTLEDALDENVKLILLNNPHNPTGKIFFDQELSQIAALVKKWPKIIVVTDEVYEHIQFQPMTRMARHLFDRTIAISSAGKTFSCTGWKVGWAVAPKTLIDPLKIIQMNA
jgi:aspartate/methionine/tyrosine aminotransferase